MLSHVSTSEIKSSSTTHPKTLVLSGKSLLHFKNVVVCMLKCSSASHLADIDGPSSAPNSMDSSVNVSV